MYYFEFIGLSQSAMSHPLKMPGDLFLLLPSLDKNWKLLVETLAATRDLAMISRIEVALSR